MIRSVSVPLAVSMTIGTSEVRRSWRQTSRPSPSGRRRSSRTRSGSSALGQVEGLSRRPRDDGLEAGSLEGLRERLGDRVLVLDEQDAAALDFAGHSITVAGGSHESQRVRIEILPALYPALGGRFPGPLTLATRFPCHLPRRRRQREQPEDEDRRTRQRGRARSARRVRAELQHRGTATQTQAALTQKPKPKVKTQVMHRTVHVKPKPKNAAAGERSARRPAGAGPAAGARRRPPSPAPAPTARPVVSRSSGAPVDLEHVAAGRDPHQRLQRRLAVAARSPPTRAAPAVAVAASEHESEGGGRMTEPVRPTAGHGTGTTARRASPAVGAARRRRVPASRSRSSPRSRASWSSSSCSPTSFDRATTRRSEPAR